MLPGVSLHEPRSVTRGAYGGPSVHVAKGLTLRVGGFQAQSHEELKEIDQGTLVLTTKRLCFSGALRSLEIDLRKLISVDAYSNAVAVRRSGKEKTEFFFGLDRPHLQLRGAGPPLHGADERPHLEVRDRGTAGPGRLRWSPCAVPPSSWRVSVRPRRSPSPRTTVLGDWYASPLDIGHQRFVLLISEHSRLPVLMAGRDLKHLADNFPDALAAVLWGLGIPAAVIQREVEATARR